MRGGIGGRLLERKSLRALGFLGALCVELLTFFQPQRLNTESAEKTEGTEACCLFHWFQFRVELAHEAVPVLFAVRRRRSDARVEG